eukprot:gene2686-3460_t
MIGNVNPRIEEEPGKPVHVVGMLDDGVDAYVEYKDIVFANFEGTTACGESSKAVVTNELAEEFYHPGRFSRIRWFNTSTAGRMSFTRSDNGGSWTKQGAQFTEYWPGHMMGFYGTDRPKIHKCESLPCDAFQHNRMADLDGSFTAGMWADGAARDVSHNISLVAMQPIYEEGGDKYPWPYHIVSACLAAEAGESCPSWMRDRANLKGIASTPQYMGFPRTSAAHGGSCEENADGNVYLCENMPHVTLHVKSTDARDLESDNTERTAAPLGVYDVSEGYLDLLAGQGSWKPGAYGEQTEYRNRNRFWPILVDRHSYQLWYTGAPPKSTDYIPVDFSDDTSILVTLTYTDSSRKSFIVDGTEVESSSTLSTVVLGAASGTNYVDSITGEVTFVITGKTTVSFKITETIQLSSTLAVEESSFYGDDFVNNIMMSLNINPLRLK